MPARTNAEPESRTAGAAKKSAAKKKSTAKNKEKASVRGRPGGSRVRLSDDELVVALCTSTTRDGNPLRGRCLSQRAGGGGGCCGETHANDASACAQPPTEACCN
jgi:hypothetical protein